MFFDHLRRDGDFSFEQDTNFCQTGHAGPASSIEDVYMLAEIDAMLIAEMALDDLGG